MTSTATEISVETTSKDSTVTTASDLYPLKIILPILIIDGLLLVNYVVTYAAMLTKSSSRDFQSSYYVLTRALVWSDVGILTAAAFYMGARLAKTIRGRQEIMPYFWWYSAAAGYLTGMILNWFLTLNRFTAIVFFTKYKVWFTIQRARYMVIFAFVVGIMGGTITNFLPFNVQHIIFISMSGSTVSLFAVTYPVCIVVSAVRVKSNMAAHDRKRYVVEIKLLAQAILIGFMLFLQEFLYQVTAGSLVYEIFYMLYGGVNPFIYLSLDVNIRRAYFRFVGFKFVDRRVSGVSNVAVGQTK